LHENQTHQPDGRESGSRARAFYTGPLGLRERSTTFLSASTAGSPSPSPDGPNDVELALEPNANPAGKAFQEAMFKQGIPVAAFEVDDIAAEHARLKAAGVVFTKDPTPMGPVTIAVFSDTCGNLSDSPADPAGT
jgi:glyoxylase I family protein